MKCDLLAGLPRRAFPRPAKASKLSRPARQAPHIPRSERVTIPAKGRYPDASFDGFLVRGARVLSCEPIAVRDISDHCPAVLWFEIN